MNQHDFPELLEKMESIVSESPLQKKRIEAFFADRDDEYRQFAEDLSRTLNHNFMTTDKDRLEAARSYDKMCTDFLSEQIKFRKTGKYRIDDAAIFMKRAKKLLAPNGQVYLSTCANCPALDHVYHFHNAEETRMLIEDAGFKIVADLALPAENVPEERWQEELITINFCGLLEHA